MKNEHGGGANAMDSVHLTLLRLNKAEHFFTHITQTKGNKTTVLPEAVGWYMGHVKTQKAFMKYPFLCSYINHKAQ